MLPTRRDSPVIYRRMPSSFPGQNRKHVRAYDGISLYSKDGRRENRDGRIIAEYGRGSFRSRQNARSSGRMLLEYAEKGSANPAFGI
jgi:hypothetical protein